MHTGLHIPAALTQRRSHDESPGQDGRGFLFFTLARVDWAAVE